MKGPEGVWAVVLAAGSGRRAGRAKQFARAGGHSLLFHACRPFLPFVEGLVVVLPPGGIAARRGREEELRSAGWKPTLRVVEGGATRHASCRAGLAALQASCRWVLVHDAARPFVSVGLVTRVLEAAAAHGAAVPAIGVKDAVLEVEDPGKAAGSPRARRYLDRPILRAVQTPQGFSKKVLEEAFAAAGDDDAPDEGSVVLAAGFPVHLVEGEESNWKITTAAELERAAQRLEEGSA